MADERSLNREEQEMTVTLTLDDDAEVKYVVLTIFSAGEHEYIALLPTEGAGSEEDEVYLYRYNETKDETSNLDNIKDGDEYEIAAKAFGELLDTQEHSRLVSKVEEE